MFSLFSLISAPLPKTKTSQLSDWCPESAGISSPRWPTFTEYSPKSTSDEQYWRRHVWKNLATKTTTIVFSESLAARVELKAEDNTPSRTLNIDFLNANIELCFRLCRKNAYRALLSHINTLLNTLECSALMIRDLRIIEKRQKMPNPTKYPEPYPALWSDLHELHNCAQSVVAGLLRNARRMETGPVFHGCDIQRRNRQGLRRRRELDRMPWDGEKPAKNAKTRANLWRCDMEREKPPKVNNNRPDIEATGHR